MDLFIDAAAMLSQRLLPILGVTVLIILIIVLLNINKLIKSLNTNTKDLDKTVDLVNSSLEKAQQPIDTVVSLSKTVDKVHESGIVVVKEAAGVIASNFTVMKDYINNQSKKGESNNE